LTGTKGTPPWEPWFPSGVVEVWHVPANSDYPKASQFDQGFARGSTLPDGFSRRGRDLALNGKFWIGALLPFRRIRAAQTPEGRGNIRL